MTKKAPQKQGKHARPNQRGQVTNRQKPQALRLVHCRAPTSLNFNAPSQSDISSAHAFHETERKRAHQPHNHTDKNLAKPSIHVLSR